MRDLQRSCWLLAAKNFKKKLKLEGGGCFGCDQRELLAVSHPWRVRERNIMLKRNCRKDIKRAATLLYAGL